MSDLNITIESGKSKRMLVAGTMPRKNIIVTALGSNYEQGVKDGKQEAIHHFWDIIQTNGETSGFIYAFSGYCLTDEIYNPVRPIITTGSSNSSYMFSHATRLTSTKVPIIIDNSNQWLSNLFTWCYNLKTIPSIKVTENVCIYSSWFDFCWALEEINFTEDSVIKANISFKDSSKLNASSVNSIIHALKDLTGETAQTLTFHADVGAKLTEEQKAAITAKNWNLVY